MSKSLSGNAYKITMYNHATEQKRFFVVIAKSAMEAIEAASSHVIGQCVELSLIDGTVLLSNNVSK